MGYLDGGYAAWQQSGEESDMIIDVEPDELMMDIPFDDRLVSSGCAQANGICRWSFERCAKHFTQ